MPMHPEYEAAQRRFRDLIGYDYMWSEYMRERWAEALEKDPTGAQCVRMVEDLEEQNREMKG
jgi:hypothetical protein